MVKIEIKDYGNGSVLFGFEKENNTLKDTLVEAVKKGVVLSFADLRGATLSFANLSGANLQFANLSGANLQFANLHCADLHCANLRRADLSGADLSGANLRDANLRRADLSGADLSGADLSGANLRGAKLTNTKGLEDYPLACPSEGAFIGWKKVYGHLVKLEIPKDARRSSATTNKCRCDKAKVLAITDLNGENPIGVIINANYVLLTYKVGEMVYPDSFDEDRWNECSHGIHFFVNKQYAIDY